MPSACHHQLRVHRYLAYTAIPCYFIIYILISDAHLSLNRTLTYDLLLSAPTRPNLALQDSEELT